MKSLYHRLAGLMILLFSLTSLSPVFAAGLEKPAARTSYQSTEIAQLNLKLPLPQGERWKVSSGLDGSNHNDGYKQWNLNAIDLVPVENGLCEGKPVLAAADGIVEDVDQDTAKGKSVRIRHAFDYGSHYLHLSEISPWIRLGKHVGQGEQLGLCGHTGNTIPTGVPGSHIHFQLFKGQWGTFSGVVPIPIDGITDEDSLRSNSPDFVSSNILNLPPREPTPAAPLNGSTVSGLTFDIRWQNQGDQDNVPRNYLEYTAEVWEADPGTWKQAFGWTQNTSMPVTVPRPGAYCWKVRADDGGTSSNWSDAWCVNVQAAPSNVRPNQPALISPANNITSTSLDVTFTIQDKGDPDNGPRTYRDFQIAYWNANTPNARTTRAWGTATTWAAKLPGHGKYCWQAIAGDGKDMSGWSGSWCFVVKPPETACLKPLYRYWNDGKQAHFYTANWAELGVGKDGWKWEGIVGYVAVNTSCYAPNAIPLFRLWSDTLQKHMYTTSATERDRLVQGGWRYESIVGYVLPAANSTYKTQPLYRLYKDSTGNHFFTASASERDSAINNSGYKSEGVACHTFSSAALP